MTRDMRWTWLAAVLIVLVLIGAWINGGRQPVRDITVAIEVPETRE